MGIGLARRLLVQRPGRLQRDSVLGHPELPVLKCAELGAEDAAAAQVGGGVVERALPHADTHRADAHSAVREAFQRGGQASARFGDDVVVWDEHVDELDVGGQLQPVAHLLVGIADNHCVAVHVDEQHRVLAVDDSYRVVMMSAAHELVIHRSRPLRRYPPLTRVAVVRIASADKSVLASGSLVAKEPTISPHTRRGRYSPRMWAGAASGVRPTSSACPSYSADEANMSAGGGHQS